MLFPNSTKNQSAGQTVKDIIDHFGTVYPAGWITYSTGIETGPTVNIQFADQTCIEALNAVAEASGYSWTVTPAGKVHFFATNPTGVTHKPTLQKDIQEIVMDEDAEELVNKYVLEYASGTVTATDAASIALYGTHEKKESDSSILDVATANAKAAAYVAKWKNPQKKTSMRINGNYVFGTGGSIEDMMVGERVTVRNSEMAISSLQIAKLQYNPEEIQVDLEGFDSFGKEFITP